MYSGITQAEMAKELFMSMAQYSRKENGQTKISLREAKKMARILEIDVMIAEKFWMSDCLFDMMKNGESCVEIPNKNCSYSSLEERMRSRKKK